MKNTHLAFILDESGSMESIKNDAIGGYNQYLTEQKDVEGNASVTLVTFNNTVTFRTNSEPIANVKALTGRSYKPKGSTALYDAIGKTINSLGLKFASMVESERPGTVIIAILTDGEENSSVEFTKQQIADMIQHQSTKYNWKFIYLGANQDAFEVGGGLNIDASSTIQFDCNSRGISLAYAATSNMVKSMRQSL